MEGRTEKLCGVSRSIFRRLGRCIRAPSIHSNGRSLESKPFSPLLDRQADVASEACSPGSQTGKAKFCRDFRSLFRRQPSSCAWDNALRKALRNREGAWLAGWLGWLASWLGRLASWLCLLYSGRGVNLASVGWPLPRYRAGRNGLLFNWLAWLALSHICFPARGCEEAVCFVS